MKKTISSNVFVDSRMQNMNKRFQIVQKYKVIHQSIVGTFLSYRY